jgi:glucose-1-phosphate adenylyltransferase
MSNCRHSHIPDIWIIEQYELHKLNEHLANGRPWDMDRTYGGLQILPPFEKHDKDKKDEKEDGKGGSKNKDKDKKDGGKSILMIRNLSHIDQIVSLLSDR